ncbi:MAG: NUMOD4 domain-containing protein [bacterium]|nr:NUMOD4 domain-containing protein [bacterium]
MNELNLENEIWKDVIGYEGLYQVSKNSSVRSLDRKMFNHKNIIKGKLLKQRLDRYGYYTVAFYKDGKRKGLLVHRLVAQNFIQNPQNLPCVNHIDGNKKNNYKENLEWVTPRDNSRHAIRMGLTNPMGSSNPNASFTEGEVIELRKIYGIGKISIAKIAKAYGKHPGYLRDVIVGKCWKNLPIFHDPKDPYSHLRQLDKKRELKVIEMYSSRTYSQKKLSTLFNVSLKVIRRTINVRQKILQA